MGEENRGVMKLKRKIIDLVSHLEKQIKPAYVDISGLDSAELLAALYNAIPFVTDTMTAEEARQFIDLRAQLIFWNPRARKDGIRIMGARDRVLRVRLDNEYMSVAEYDQAYGSGAARRVVRTLRRQMRQERKKRLKALAL